jgi:hypothetical protein
MSAKYSMSLLIILQINPLRKVNAKKIKFTLVFNPINTVTSKKNAQIESFEFIANQINVEKMRS